MVAESAFTSFSVCTEGIAACDKTQQACLVVAETHTILPEYACINDEKINNFFFMVVENPQYSRGMNKSRFSNKPDITLEVYRHLYTFIPTDPVFCTCKYHEGVFIVGPLPTTRLDTAGVPPSKRRASYGAARGRENVCCQECGGGRAGHVGRRRHRDFSGVIERDGYMFSMARSVF